MFVRFNAEGTASQLWLMDRHGRHQRQLTFDAPFKDQVPDWRPDGKQIAYMALNDIWVINPDGSRTGQHHQHTQRPRVRHRLVTGRRRIAYLTTTTAGSTP